MKEAEWSEKIVSVREMYTNYPNSFRAVSINPTLLIYVDNEMIRLRAENEHLRDCIAESAPLAWITGKYNEHAIEWEKKAAVLAGVCPRAHGEGGREGG